MHLNQFTNTDRIFEQVKRRHKHKSDLDRKVELTIKFQIHSMEVVRHPHNLVFIQDNRSHKFMEISSITYRLNQYEFSTNSFHSIILGMASHIMEQHKPLPVLKNK